MYQYVFRLNAEKELKKLPRDVQIKILKKLKYFIASSDVLNFAVRLKDYGLGMYRFRIGDYRVIFDLEDQNIIILTLGHRREIYR